MKDSFFRNSLTALNQKARKLWYRILLFGFHLLYNNLAWTYDLVSWIVSMGQWRAWQRVGIAHLTGNRVLELGHGPGHMLVELATDGYQVTGLDLSPYMSRMAADRLDRATLSASLVRGHAQTIPFSRNSFDSILATFPAQFIVEPETISSMNRILVPSGRIVIIPEARLSGHGPIQLLIQWLYRITGQSLSSDDDTWETLLWQKAKTNFQSAGFRIELDYISLDNSIVTVILAKKRR